MGKIESIELEASRRTSRKQQKKLALERMMTYWFEKDNAASLNKLADILDEMNMNRPNEQDRQDRSNGQCGTDKILSTIRMLIWNMPLEENDIDVVVEAIDSSSLNPAELAKNLNVKNNPDLKTVLKAWINCNRVNATWNKLVHHVENVEPECSKALVEKLKGTHS